MSLLVSLPQDPTIFSPHIHALMKTPQPTALSPIWPGASSRSQQHSPCAQTQNMDATQGTTKAICLHVTKGGDTESVTEAFTFVKWLLSTWLTGKLSLQHLFRQLPRKQWFSGLLHWNCSHFMNERCMWMQEQRRSDKTWRGKMLLQLKKRSAVFATCVSKWDAGV